MIPLKFIENLCKLTTQYIILLTIHEHIYYLQQFQNRACIITFEDFIKEICTIKFIYNANGYNQKLSDRILNKNMKLCKFQ